MKLTIARLSGCSFNEWGNYCGSLTVAEWLQWLAFLLATGRCLIGLGSHPGVVPDCQALELRTMRLTLHTT
jgi:hypothetical protein